ncbi:MAG: hypothetical protein Kow0022_08490 [Phycisphaerales bacterium]
MRKSPINEGSESRPSDPQSKPARGSGALLSWLIGPAFLGVAAVILYVIPSEPVPTSATPAIRDASISIEPVRTPKGDPPTTFINGFDRRCNDCHSIIEPRENSQADLQQHSDIVLRHGLNNSCLNCHDREDRERLVLHDGSTIGYAAVEQLCAQCHGRVYRDWTRGAHGKTMGSWRRDDPRFHRLTCTNCHDPHAPMFGSLEPLPGPSTLRMGKPSSGHHDRITSKRNPLLLWSEPSQTGQAPHSGGGHE